MSRRWQKRHAAPSPASCALVASRRQVELENEHLTAERDRLRARVKYLLAALRRISNLSTNATFLDAGE